MQRKKEKYFTTGEFAAYFGIRKDTLFYYDRIGLFQPEGVGDNGYRYYSDAQITPFSALLSLREMGVPIRELQSYFGNPSPERLLALASDKIRKMDEEIRRLQETRRLFSEIAEHTGEARDAAIGQTEFLRMPERRFIYSEKLDLNMENATGEQWGDAYARFARQAGTVGAVIHRLRPGQGKSGGREIRDCGPSLYARGRQQGEKRARQASTRFCTIRDLIGRWPGPTGSSSGRSGRKGWFWTGIPMRNIWWKPWRPGKRRITLQRFP